jgi:hypothetical protein
VKICQQKEGGRERERKRKKKKKEERLGLLFKVFL